MANLPNTEEEDANDTEAQKKARVMHNKARYFLVLAMLKQSLLYLMPNTATDEWPGGLVHEFLKKLQKKFKPQDTVSVTELKTSLAKLKLKAGEDPAKLHDDIAEIQNRRNNSNYTVDETDLIAAVITTIPKEFVIIGLCMSKL